MINVFCTAKTIIAKLGVFMVPSYHHVTVHKEKIFKSSQYFLVSIQVIFQMFVVLVDYLIVVLFAKNCTKSTKLIIMVKFFQYKQ